MIIKLMAENIEAQPEEAVEEQQKPSCLTQIKIHKFKIVVGILGAFIFVGAVFGAYRLGRKQIQLGLLPTPTPELAVTQTPVLTPGVTQMLTPIPQPISIPDDWQEYTAIDPEFGIKTTLSLPPGFSFSFSGSEFTIQNADATELWDYSTSVFQGKDGLKNYYAGGSRRDWYQKLLEGEFWTEKPYQFVAGKITNAIEHQIGTQTYLELTVTGGPPTNYSGEVGTHFIYAQNGIIHIIKPASHKANSAEAQLPENIGIVFYSLKSSRMK